MSIKLKDTISENINSANKLSTSRSIWGQSFNGEGNVSGSIDNCNWIRYYKGGSVSGYIVGRGEEITGGDGLGLWTYGNTPIFLGTGSRQRMTLDSSGNIGIGTTNPSSKLDVQGDIYTSSALKFKHGQLITNPNAGNGFIIRNGSGTNIGELAYHQDHLYLCNYFGSVENSGIEFKDNGDISLFTKSGKPFYIKGGSIGMGTTEPEAKLHIIGKLKFTDWDNDGTFLRVENPNKGKAFISIYSTGSNAYTLGQDGSRFLINHNSYGDVFNILNGNIGIGTTNPSYRLHVNGSFNATSGYVGGNTILTSGNWSSYCAPASHSHNYLSLSGGTLSADKRELLRLSDTNTSSNNRGGYITFHSGNSTAKYGAVGINTSIGAFFEYHDGSSLHSLHITNDGYLKYKNNLIYHAGNFNPSNYIPITGGTLNITAGIIFGAKYSGDIFGYNPSYGTYIGGGNNGTAPFTKGYWIYAGNDNSPMPRFCKGTSIYKIWCEDNDGSGSGLDADLLDGKHASAFSLSHTHPYLSTSGGTLAGPLKIDINDINSSQLYITASSYTSLRFFAWSDATYIESGNGDFSDNAPLRLTGISGGTGSSIYLNFTNIYCRSGNYINIDSGNYTSYCATSGHTHSYLPLSGGTLSKSGRDLLTLTDTNTSTDQRGAYAIFNSSGTSNRLAIGYNSTTGGFFEYYRSANNKYYSLLIDPSGVLKFDNNVVLTAGNWSSYISVNGNYVPNNTASTITGQNSYLIIGQTSGTPGISSARKLRLGLGTAGHTGAQYWGFSVDDTTGNSYLQIGYGGESSNVVVSIRHDGLMDMSSLSIGGQVITFTT